MNDLAPNKGRGEGGAEEEKVHKQELEELRKKVGAGKSRRKEIEEKQEMEKEKERRRNWKQERTRAEE